MESRSVPWWKQVLGYFGVCVVEALVATLLLIAHVCLVIPATARSNGAGAFCALMTFFFLLPAMCIGTAVVFMVAKVAVVLVPPARRHLLLALYWGLAAVWFVREALRIVPQPGVEAWRELVFLGGFFLVPPLVLTLSHFLLIPRVAPGGSAFAALRALVRRPAKTPPT